jgi:hypothetical protein
LLAQAGIRSVDLGTDALAPARFRFGVQAPDQMS